MTDTLKGWPLLHSKLPPQALKAIPESAYGVAGLTDVNEGFLIQRLFASGLAWEWHLTGQTYLGSEDRKVRDKDYTTRYYLASIQGVLTIEGKQFHGSGGHDNRKLDAAFKGAATVAFKNACKIAGLTIELFKDGKAMDFIYELGEGTAPTSPPLPRSSSVAPSPFPRTPEQILNETRAKMPAAPAYDADDAVCAVCGRKEGLRPVGNPRFCAKGEGGCGAPERGAVLQLTSYAEWRKRHA